MTEQTAETTVTETVTETPPAKPEIDWAAESKKWEKRAKENKTAADELAALKQAQMSDAERTAARLEQMERETQAARTEALRFRIATRHGISDEDAELYLTATDEETLERQAKGLADRSAQTTARPRADADQGARPQTPPALNSNALEQALAKKLGVT
jgi:hypothetical protein